MRIRWTSPAADDLEAIKAYLDVHYPSFSRQTISKLYRALHSLKMMPERGRPGFREGTRELILHPLPYVVLASEKAREN